MDIEITGYYCVCADFLKSVNYLDDPQCQVSTAEIMTAALTAAAFFPAVMKLPASFSKNIDISLK